MKLTGQRCVYCGGQIVTDGDEVRCLQCAREPEGERQAPDDAWVNRRQEAQQNRRARERTRGVSTRGRKQWS